MKNSFEITARLGVLASLWLAAWVVMTLTHELGHILGGLACGGTLVEADLVPWRMPYSVFSPDPLPVVTLWSGPILGVLAPLGIAMTIRQSWMWLIASFCTFANGMYLGVAWFTGDSLLDTAKLLQHGAWPISILAYCGVTILPGYLGLRAGTLRVLYGEAPTRAPLDSETASERPTHQRLER